MREPTVRAIASVGVIDADQPRLYGAQCQTWPEATESLGYAPRALLALAA